MSRKSFWWRVWRISKAELIYKEALFSLRMVMPCKKELLNTTTSVWQSFSSEQFLESDYILAIEDLLILQWFCCHLSSNQLVVLGIDQHVGYLLAEDMFKSPINTLSEDDEQDAVIELMNCICGQLDRDHPANECFERPKLLEAIEMKRFVRNLNKLSEVTAKIGNEYFYIAIFDGKDEKSGGEVE